MEKLGAIRLSFDGKNLDDMLAQYFATLIRKRTCGLCFVQSLERPANLPPNLDRHHQWDLFRALAPRWDSFFSVPPTHEPFSEEGLGLGILSRGRLTNPFRVLLPGGRLIAGAHRELDGHEMVVLNAQLGRNPHAEQIKVLSTLVLGQKKPVVLALDCANYEEYSSQGLTELKQAMDSAGMKQIPGSGIFTSRQLEMKHRLARSPAEPGPQTMVVEITVLP